MTQRMKAMTLSEPGAGLSLTEVAIPRPAVGELLIKVHVCAICRTDLHVIDGEILDGCYPITPGHQIVGTVVACGEKTPDRLHRRVGVPWLGYTCGDCGFCLSAQENLCDRAEFTGYQRPGGFAEYVVADSRYCFDLPKDYADAQIAPLLCAGLIGYRAYAMVGGAQALGFYGFGSAAHILTQLAAWQGRQVFAFTRKGDLESQRFALSLGAQWAGASGDKPARALDAAIIFAPAGALVPEALRQVRKGGIVVCAGIHMSDIPSFPYADLWGERCIRSVANLTRNDAIEMLKLAPQVPIRTEISTYPLEDAARALEDLRVGAFQGSAVIQIS